MIQLSMQDRKLITANSPYPFRLKLWLDERFPIFNFISGFFIYFFAKAVVDLGSIEPHQNFQIKDIAGMLIPAMHLFLLRVFDEHKDFETDQLNYPNRVVQQGIFKLREIRNLGVGAIFLQIVSLFAYGPSKASIGFFILLWAWTFLMTKEFFCKTWLKARLFLYGLSHLLVTPLLFLFNLELCAADQKPTESWIWALLLALLTGWLYEVTRKTKGIEEETKDQSYSQLWGFRKSILVVSVTALATAVVTITFFRSINIVELKYNIILLFILVFGWLAQWAYFKNPVKSNRKKNEGVSALLTIYSMVLPIIVAFLKS